MCYNTSFNKKKSVWYFNHVTSSYMSVHNLFSLNYCVIVFFFQHYSQTLKSSVLLNLIYWLCSEFIWLKEVSIYKIAPCPSPATLFIEKTIHILHCIL